MLCNLMRRSVATTTVRGLQSSATSQKGSASTRGFFISGLNQKRFFASSNRVDPLPDSERGDVGYHAHGREYLRPVGGMIDGEELEAEYFHDVPWADMARGGPQRTFRERGKLWVTGVDRRKHLAEMWNYLGDQRELPYTSRKKLIVYGNYDYLMKMEYLFFCVPTFLVVGICVPAFALIYSIDDTIDCDMVVKIIGRQWFWVYEVESPTGDDDEDEDDD